VERLPEAQISLFLHSRIEEEWGLKHAIKTRIKFKVTHVGSCCLSECFSCQFPQYNLEYWITVIHILSGDDPHGQAREI
jgi:hypothetical protein